MAHSERQPGRGIENFYQEFWGKDVPPCDRTVKEVADLRRDKRGTLFIPDGLTIGHLDKIFPTLLSDDRLSSIKKLVMEKWDEPVVGGWRDVEMDLDAPNKKTTKDQSVTLFTARGKELQSLPIFVAASYANKKLTGHYFEEDSWTRLSDSWENGDDLAAGFGPSGQLRVIRINPEKAHQNIGARSEGRKAM
jgi:hypothetical protein